MFEDAFTNGKLEVLLHNYFIFWNKVWNCVLKVVTLEPPLDWKVLKTALWGKENKGNADYLYLCKEEKNTYSQILGQEILFSQLSFFFSPVMVLSVSIWSFLFPACGGCLSAKMPEKPG